MVQVCIFLGGKLANFMDKLSKIKLLIILISIGT